MDILLLFGILLFGLGIVSFAIFMLYLGLHYFFVEKRKAKDEGRKMRLGFIVFMIISIIIFALCAVGLKYYCYLAMFILH